MTPNGLSKYRERIRLLEAFREDVRSYFKTKFYSEGEQEEIRRSISRNLPAVKSVMKEIGIGKSVTVAIPPMAGGGTMGPLDPLENIFNNFYGDNMYEAILDIVDQAIGVYENLENDTGLVRIETAQAIDVVGAIERALRPSFRKAKPSSEQEVQDAIENILTSIGIEYKREKETAPVGPRASKPDFVIPSQDLALEVKLATDRHKATDIQEEMFADISAYRTKWKRILFVIYDLGVISDPYKMRRDNIKHFGVSVIIIKH